MTKVPVYNHTTQSMLLLVLLALSLMDPLSAHANRRVTKEQIAKRAQESELLWTAPGSNYAAISSIFIQPGIISRDEVLKRLVPAWEQAGCAQDKGALNYLTGEAHYWGGLAELRQTRKQSVLLGMGDKAVSAYLDAWISATNAGTGTPATDELRQTIASRLNQVLSTEVCGGTLATNLKQQVVAHYINIREAAGTLAPAMSALHRLKIYANLGIQNRLLQKIPATMPTNFLAVCEAMEWAIAVGATNEALRFAGNLQTAHADELGGHAARLRQVYTLYRDSRDPRAEPCVKALAAVDPKGWLDLYDYSVQQDVNFPLEQRRKCLDEYFKGLEAERALRAGSYRVAMERLLAHEDYALVLEVSDVALHIRSRLTAGPSMDRALIWRSKAIAHEKRGEKEKADEAYRLGLDDVKFMGRTELESIFQRGAGAGVKSAGLGGENR